EKGYDSDLIKWGTVSDLTAAFRRRLDIISLEPILVTDSIAACAYFTEASLRKEPVFLSYSGEDRSIAVDISLVLRKKFQTVFDYREKQAMKAGQDWPSQIEKAIEGSALGVQLISNSYFASSHCTREALLMDARRLAGRMAVVRIKIQDGQIDRMPLSQTLDQ